MERLTFDGNFCEIAQCAEVRGGYLCEDGACSQRKVWERLKAYEDTGLSPEAVTDMTENVETRLLTWFSETYGVGVGKLMDIGDRMAALKAENARLHKENFWLTEESVNL